jgi:hypothetical protein
MLVEAINFLASKLNLPDYSQTSKKQLRELRMRLMLFSPRFMGRGAIAVNVSAVSEYMSPMQAFHLTQTLVDQKFWQPEYQVTPAEWDQQTHEVIPRSITASGQRTASIRLANFPRSMELHQRMTAALSKLNDYDAIELATQVLHQAGGTMIRFWVANREGVTYQRSGLVRTHSRLLALLALAIFLISAKIQHQPQIPSR